VPWAEILGRSEEEIIGLPGGAIEFFDRQDPVPSAWQRLAGKLDLVIAKQESRDRRGIAFAPFIRVEVPRPVTLAEGVFCDGR
jgi:hypothetical protein